MNLLKDILTYLTAQGTIQGENTDGFIEYRPDEPTALIAVFEYPGMPTAPNVDAVVRAVQVNIRAATYEDARVKAWAAFHKLVPEDGILVLTAERTCIVIANQVPFRMNKDSTGRVTFAFNLSITTVQD